MRSIMVKILMGLVFLAAVGVVVYLFSEARQGDKEAPPGIGAPLEESVPPDSLGFEEPAAVDTTASVGGP